MSDPTREQQIRLLIRRGIMPSEAERIVDRAEAIPAGSLVAEPEPSIELQAQRAQAWFQYQAIVPHRFKRLLGAEERKPKVHAEAPA